MQNLLGRIKDRVLWGLVLGLLGPAILSVLAFYLRTNFVAFKKADLLLIGCVASNVLWMNWFFKQHKENAAKGIISATFIYAFVFFVYKMMQESTY